MRYTLWLQSTVIDPCDASDKPGNEIVLAQSSPPAKRAREDRAAALQDREPPPGLIFILFCFAEAPANF